MKTEIIIHPYADRVFTLLEFEKVPVTIEIGHTEDYPVLNFVVLVDGAEYQEK